MLNGRILAQRASQKLNALATAAEILLLEERTQKIAAESAAFGNAKKTKNPTGEDWVLNII
jgi:hypothetical protein